MLRPFSSHSMSLPTWRFVQFFGRSSKYPSCFSAVGQFHRLTTVAEFAPREFCKEFELKAKLQGTRRVGRKGCGIGYGIFRTFSKHRKWFGENPATGNSSLPSFVVIFFQRWVSPSWTPKSSKMSSPNSLQSMPYKSLSMIGWKSNTFSNWKHADTDTSSSWFSCARYSVTEVRSQVEAGEDPNLTVGSTEWGLRDLNIKSTSPMC